jgi:hypothetical protein
MKDNDMLLYGALGLGVLYLMYKSSPTVQANTLAAQQANASLAAAQIAANQQATNIQTGSDLVQNLVSDFSGN